jgi:hypothetical protein
MSAPTLTASTASAMTSVRRAGKAAKRGLGGRSAEGRRRLLFRQVEEVAAGDHEPVLLAKLVHGGEQLFTLLGPEERRLGGGGRLPRGSVPGRAQRETRATAGRAPAVAGLVGHDL